MKKPADIALSRLVSQQITKPGFDSVKDLVSYMGAMQAQDYAMAKWAVGCRIPDCTEKDVEAAINKGQVIRTHVLRPTWHLIAADDIYWMLELSQKNISTALRSRQKELELSDKTITSINNLLEKLLDGGKHLTREEIVDGLKKAKIATDNNRSSHILMHAELAGLLSSGKSKNSRHTYTLLSDWVKKKKSLHREEALAKLALTYFTSHGPATLADFTWWSGLSVKDARQALELVKEKLVSEKISEQTYWLDVSLKLPAKQKPSLQLLPAFDEYLISYKNRTASLLAEDHKKTFSINGIFWPTVVANGQVKGLWKRSIKKDTVLIETDFFMPHDKGTIRLIETAAQHFGKFLEKKVELI